MILVAAVKGQRRPNKAKCRRVQARHGRLIWLWLGLARFCWCPAPFAAVGLAARTGRPAPATSSPRRSLPASRDVDDRCALVKSVGRDSVGRLAGRAAACPFVGIRRPRPGGRPLAIAWLLIGSGERPRSGRAVGRSSGQRRGAGPSLPAGFLAAAGAGRGGIARRSPAVERPRPRLYLPSPPARARYPQCLACGSFLVRHWSAPRRSSASHPAECVRPPPSGCLVLGPSGVRG